MRQAVDTWAIRAISDGDVRQYRLSVCFTVINVHHLKYNKGPDAQLVPDIYPPGSHCHSFSITHCLYREDIYIKQKITADFEIQAMSLTCEFTGCPYLHGMLCHCAYTALRLQTGSWKEGPKYLNKVLLLKPPMNACLFKDRKLKLFYF